jgi:hypothetical protein
MAFGFTPALRFSFPSLLSLIRHHVSEAQERGDGADAYHPYPCQPVSSAHEIAEQVQHAEQDHTANPCRDQDLCLFVHRLPILSISYLHSSLQFAGKAGSMKRALYKNYTKTKGLRMTNTRNPLISLVGQGRIELPTLGFSVRCSTD